MDTPRNPILSVAMITFDGDALRHGYQTRRRNFAMKRKSVGAKIIAVVMLSMLMIMLSSCNGADKKASAISTSSAVAEATITAEPLSVVGNTEHVEGKVYTFDKTILKWENTKTSASLTSKCKRPLSTSNHLGT